MINALPSSLKSYVNDIQMVIESWSIKISLDHAIRWVLQFEADDYDLAVRILKNIDVLGSNQVRFALEIAHTKMVRKISEKGAPIKGGNTLFAAIGGSSKSGSLIAYHYRVTAEISENDFVDSDDEDFLDLSKVDNIVLVDDVIGSGKTIVKEVKRVAEDVYSLARSRNIFVLTVAGYTDGIKHIVEESGANVVTALEYNTLDTVANLDSKFYNGMAFSERAICLEKIKKYCRNISSSTLGYSELGGLLVFDHNTPNTTLPIIWSSSKSWKPLFPRAGKIIGTAKILTSAEKERVKSTPSISAQPLGINRSETELTLFVEGKVDEIFVDYLNKKQALHQRLNVGSINAVALGGLYQSPRLFDLLRTSKKYAIFLLDDDEHSRKASRQLNGVEVMYLTPSFAALLDTLKIYSHRERFPDLPDATSSNNDSRWLHQVEMATLKRWPVYANSDKISQVIDEFLDISAYEEFSTKLKSVTDKIFEK